MLRMTCKEDIKRELERVWELARRTSVEKSPGQGLPVQRLHQQNKLGIAALANSAIDCTNYMCL